MSRTIRIVRRGGLAATALALALAPILAPSSPSADSVNGSWAQMAFPLPPPNTAPTRQASTIVYDSGHDRLVMFGGISGSTLNNDVWTLDLTQPSTWTQVSLPAAPKPEPRYRHMSIYDPVNDRIIVFGGLGESSRGPEYENDVWQLTLTGVTPTWTLLSPSGLPPARREGGAVVYDAGGQRMILFGGYSDATGYTGDTWVLSLSGTLQWTQLSTTGISPPVRELGLFAYDSNRGSMIVFGGWDGTNYLDDAWELDLTGAGSWAPITASGAPTARREGVGVYDPATQCFNVYGGLSAGYSGSSVIYQYDVWQLSLAGSAQWTQLGPSGAAPSGSEGVAGCFDSARGRFAVFGGYNGTNVCSDLHFLSLPAASAWSYPFESAGTDMSRRADNTTVIRSDTRQMITFGGTGPLTSTGDNSQVWTLDPTSPTNFWSLATPTGASAPSARHGHRAVWDPVANTMIVMGGFDYQYRNDLWSLSPDASFAWNSLTLVPGPLPVGRAYFGFALDSNREQLVLVGGVTSELGTPTLLNDVWVLPLHGPGSFRWNQLAPLGTPPEEREIFGMQYDPVGDRMIFFGGQTATDLKNDVWALNLSGSPSWSQLLPSGTPPTGRSGHAMVYDPDNQRMLVFGGYDDVYRNDAWALQLGASPAWTPLTPDGPLPPARYLFSAVFDPVGRQMLFLGGWTSSGLLADTWALSFTPPVTAVPVAPPDLRFALDGARPNPSSGDRLSIAFSLPRAERARLDVLDLAGRKVASRDASAAAGRQVIAVTPPRALNPGVYMVRLTAGEGSRSAKVAVVR